MTKSSPRKVRETPGIRMQTLKETVRVTRVTDAPWILLNLDKDWPEGTEVYVTVERLSPRCGGRKK